MSANLRQSVFSDVAEFIISQPSLEAVIEYKMPEAMEQRIHALLDKNRETGLSVDEREEMEKFMAVSHLMTLAKAKARLKLANAE